MSGKEGRGCVIVFFYESSVCTFENYFSILLSPFFLSFSLSVSVSLSLPLSVSLSVSLFLSLSRLQFFPMALQDVLLSLISTHRWPPKRLITISTGSRSTVMRSESPTVCRAGLALAYYNPNLSEIHWAESPRPHLYPHLCRRW